MDQWDSLAVDHHQALRFFFERLRDVSQDDPPTAELLYNASVLAHFATTSTASLQEFPATPNSLTKLFDVFVLDRSQQADPQLMEAAAAQCLLLTGFFRDQLKERHNVAWFAMLGAGFYDSAAHLGGDQSWTRMMGQMAVRFDFWRRQMHRLAHELRDTPLLIVRGSGDVSWN
ncbi:MAG: hypothetical protein ABI051_12970 [Vicinamibacterales bacterium]